MIEAVESYSERGARPVVLDEPCPHCGGRVQRERDPDKSHTRSIADITFCVSCATIFSPWTMEEHRSHRERTERR